MLAVLNDFLIFSISSVSCLHEYGFYELIAAYAAGVFPTERAYSQVFLG